MHVDAEPIPVAARSKAWVSGCSQAAIASSNPAGAWVFFCCDFCVSPGRCLVQRSHTNCGMPNTCDRHASYVEAMSRNGVETHHEKKSCISRKT